LDSASAKTQFFTHVLAGVVVTAIACSLLRAIYFALFGPTSFIHFPAITFGAILGAWLGFYMAATSAPSIARRRLHGFSVRALAVGGLLGGLFGPLLNWFLAESVLGYNLMPGRFTPLFGLASAFGFGLVSWKRPSSDVAQERAT
jgi:hypothetical protein